jgi:hypothetical protein
MKRCRSPIPNRLPFTPLHIRFLYLTLPALYFPGGLSSYQVNAMTSPTRSAFSPIYVVSVAQCASLSKDDNAPLEKWHCPNRVDLQHASRNSSALSPLSRELTVLPLQDAIVNLWHLSHHAVRGKVLGRVIADRSARQRGMHISIYVPRSLIYS